MLLVMLAVMVMLAGMVVIVVVLVVMLVVIAMIVFKACFCSPNVGIYGGYGGHAAIQGYGPILLGQVFV